PLIEIDGSSVGGAATGFKTSGSGVANISGFAIFGFFQAGIDLGSVSGKVFANFLGPTAQAVKPAKKNGFGSTAGLAGGGQTHLTGGPTAADRNIIAGNGPGISMSGSGVTIQNNFIGPAPAGTALFDNFQTGISAGDGNGNLVDNNVIS